MSDAKPHPWPRTTKAALAIALGLALAGCHSKDSASMMADARQFRDQGDIKAAVIQAKNVIQRDSGNRAARVLLGELYLDQGDALSAEKELRRALSLGADSGNVTLMLARALLMQGQYERLLADIAPDAAPAQKPALLAMRANALLGLQRIEPARALFNQALTLHPDTPDALLGLVRIANWERQPDTARDLLRRALAANPDDVECLRYQADLLRAEGNGAAALEIQQKILRRRPHQAQALVDIANLHTDAGHYAEAHSALAQARKVSGASLGVLYSEAMLSFRENKLGAALEAVQHVLRAAPEHYPSILLAGAIESASGAHAQAEQHLRAFLHTYPDHVYAGKLLAGVQLATQHADAALAIVRPLLAAHPNDAELLALAGEASLRSGNFSAAAGYFELASARQPQVPALHTGLALSRLGSGDSARAVEELERAASLDPAPARTGVLLVMTYLRANMPDKALKAVQEMEKQGNNPLIQNLKGGIFLARKDLPGARACFDQALMLDPAYLPALANLTQLDAIEHRTADSPARYQRALAKAPTNSALMEALAVLAMAQRKPADAIAWMERALAAEPDSLPLALRAGQLYLRAGEKSKALVLARALLASHPDNIDSLALLGQAHVANGKLTEAADDYSRMAALAPRAALPQIRLASVAIAQKRNGPAQDALRKALALEPGNVEARLTLVNLMVMMGKYSDALALAADARQRQPDAPGGYKLEGDVHSAQGNHAAALQAYEKALALDPRGPFLVQVYGALIKLGRQGDADTRANVWLREHPADIPTRLYFASSKLVKNEPRAAIPHYQAVLKVDPDNLAALNDLAWSYQRLGDRQALGFAQRAYQLAPDNPAIIDTLGWIYLEQGELARALPLLQKASALAPQSAEIHYHYGMLLARSGDKRGARRELEKALADTGFARRDDARALLGTL
jgi:putative PEP-CTERM system TPR-repeat lipoprotein